MTERYCFVYAMSGCGEPPGWVIPDRALPDRHLRVGSMKVYDHLHISLDGARCVRNLLQGRLYAASLARWAFRRQTSGPGS